MRIGVIGPTAPDDFADNILDTLPRLNHEPISIGTAQPSWRGRTGRFARQLLEYPGPLLAHWQSRLIRRAKAARVDAVISVESALLPETVSGLRSTGARVALWYPDANIGRQLMLLAPYDALFFKEPLLVSRLTNLLDVPAYYLPEACNPSWHRPVRRDTMPRELVVAGNIYPSRLRLLEQLNKDGVPLVLYGGRRSSWLGDWEVLSLHTGTYLARHEKAAVFRNAAGVLNNLHPAEMGSNARLFEAAGCGAAVLCEDRPALHELFDADREVIFFSTYEQLLDRARRLVEDPALTERIGDAAATRAHAEHTYDRRLVDLLERLV